MIKNDQPALSIRPPLSSPQVTSLIGVSNLNLPVPVSKADYAESTYSIVHDYIDCQSVTSPSADFIMVDEKTNPHYVDLVDDSPRTSVNEQLESQYEGIDHSVLETKPPAVYDRLSNIGGNVVI